MNTDDPKLTAYVLGELDPAEREAMEAALRDDPQARAHVAELRAFAGLLGRDLKAETPETALEPEQRRALLEESTPAVPARRIPFLPGNTMEWLRMAALLALGLLPFRYMSEQMPMKAPVPESPEFRGSAGADGRLADSLDAVNRLDLAAENQSRLEATRSSVAVREVPVPVAAPTPPSVEALSRGSDQEIKVKESPELSRSFDSRLTREQAIAIRDFTAGWSKNSGEKTQQPLRQHVAPRELNASWSRAVRGSRGAAALGTRPRPVPSVVSGPMNTEAYATVEEQPFFVVRETPLSTFGVDVDTASYSNLRRLLMQGQRPPVGAVRIEELLNYFPYEYAAPKEGEAPFRTTIEVSECPWAPEHRLMRIGLKGREIAAEKRPPGNLVFLIDSSGSMNSENKMPLLKESMRLLIGQLREEDTVSIVTYAGSAGLVLPPTSGADKAKIAEALDGLNPGGSTNGAGGIQLAYQTARDALEAGSGKRSSRVILATDGDFNVGVTDESELVRLIEKEAKDGIFLTILGFGSGNLKDSTMEKIANRGNGQYAYIDSLREGRKVLVEQIGGTLETIAKDVKIQIEFNPAQVSSYRLIGYENRALRKEDFNDDKKDAGEIGAGHTVTALYELVPAGREGADRPRVDPLRYQPQPSPVTPAATGGARQAELLTVKLRYKEPDGETSRLQEFPVPATERKLSQSTADFRFAAAVAQFGMLLRGSAHAGNATWNGTLELAEEGLGEDPGGYRAEFLEMIRRARSLMGEE